MKEVLEFLQAIKIFYLATIDGEQARVRPLGFVMEYDGKLFFGVGDQKEVYKQIKANPQIEMSAASSEFKWVRITGTAVFDERPEVAEAAFKALPMLKDLYGDPSGPKLGTFYLKNAQARFFDRQGNVSTVKL